MSSEFKYMKKLLQISVISLLLVGSVAYSLASERTSLKPQSLKNSLILDIVNRAETQELNKLPGGSEANVKIRLLSIAEEGDCVPGTHYVCSNKYYLGIIEYGQVSAQSVFYLGKVGEIKNIQWIKTKGIEGAVLEMTVLNYSGYVFSKNTKYKKVEKRYRIFIEMSFEGKPPYTYNLTVK